MQNKTLDYDKSRALWRQKACSEAWGKTLTTDYESISQKKFINSFAWLITISSSKPSRIIALQPNWLFLNSTCKQTRLRLTTIYWYMWTWARIVTDSLIQCQWPVSNFKYPHKFKNTKIQVPSSCSRTNSDVQSVSQILSNNANVYSSIELNSICRLFAVDCQKKHEIGARGTDIVKMQIDSYLSFNRLVNVSGIKHYAEVNLFRNSLRLPFSFTPLWGADGKSVVVFAIGAILFDTIFNFYSTDLN